MDNKLHRYSLTEQEKVFLALLAKSPIYLSGIHYKKQEKCLLIL